LISKIIFQVLSTSNMAPVGLHRNYCLRLLSIHYS